MYLGSRPPQEADIPPRSRHTPQSRHPPEADPPRGRHPPPLGADTPPWSRHPPLGAYTPPWEQTPPQKQTPPQEADTPPRGRHPLGADTPHPPSEAGSGIRSMSGRYASYWNAFLFDITCKHNYIGPTLEQYVETKPQCRFCSVQMHLFGDVVRCSPDVEYRRRISDLYGSRQRDGDEPNNQRHGVSQRHETRRQQRDVSGSSGNDASVR